MGHTGHGHTHAGIGVRGNLGTRGARGTRGTVGTVNENAWGTLQGLRTLGRI